MDCKNCAGGCHGCTGSLELTKAELDILEALGQFAFLPVARAMDDPTPIYREDTRHAPAAYSLALELLEKKQLISLDFDRPLANMADAKYLDFPILGSIALTQRGQKVLEIIEKQGITP